MSLQVASPLFINKKHYGSTIVIVCTRLVFICFVFLKAWWLVIVRLSNIVFTISLQVASPLFLSALFSCERIVEIAALLKYILLLVYILFLKSYNFEWIDENHGVVFYFFEITALLQYIYILLLVYILSYNIYCCWSNIYCFWSRTTLNELSKSRRCY